MVEVVAAIIEQNGRILICRRTAHQSHPLKWEFPGGKVEPGESPEQALTRELQEELGIAGSVGQEITRYQYAYSGRAPIVLIFFRVTAFTGSPQNLIFEEIRWEQPDRLAGFDFVEGDLEFLHSLARRLPLGIVPNTTFRPE
jgi:8-oxo-dGTP diphosphatase